MKAGRQDWTEVELNFLWNGLSTANVQSLKNSLQTGKAQQIYFFDTVLKKPNISINLIPRGVWIIIVKTLIIKDGLRWHYRTVAHHWVSCEGTFLFAWYAKRLLQAPYLVCLKQNGTISWWYEQKIVCTVCSSLSCIPTENSQHQFIDCRLCFRSVFWYYCTSWWTWPSSQLCLPSMGHRSWDGSW